MSRPQQVDVLLAGVCDNVGDSLSGGKIYTYLAGTTTPSALWAAQDKSSYATNPIILDANGRAKVWAEGSYKFVIKTSSDVSVDTFDNLVYGVSDKDTTWAGLSTGSSNTYILSPVPAVTEYENGHYTSFIANHSNSGATTLNISGLGAVDVKTGTGSALSGGEIVSGNIVTVVYDSVSGYFILDSSSNFSSITVSGAGTFGSVVSPILQGAGTIAIKPSGVQKWDFLSGGGFAPTTNNDVDLGSSSLRVKAGYFVAVNTPEVVSSTGSTLTVHSASGSAFIFGDGSNSWLVSTGNLVPGITNSYSIGSSSYVVSTGYFTKLQTPEVTSASGSGLTVHSASGSALTIGDGTNSWLINDGNLFPGSNNSYDLGGGSWLIKCGYFTKVQTASSVSPSGDAYYFGSGSTSQWVVTATSATLWPLNNNTSDLGGSSHNIKDIYFKGKLINIGYTYVPGTEGATPGTGGVDFTALATITHPSYTTNFLNASYDTGRGEIQTHLRNLYRLIATLMGDLVA